jgi:hypothetical protein
VSDDGFEVVLASALEGPVEAFRGGNLRAGGDAAGIPHESVPGLFRVFPAFMAIYARFPVFSGGPPFVRFPVGIP